MACFERTPLFRAGAAFRLVLRFCRYLRQRAEFKMTKPTQHCHIVTDDAILGGEPIINGARTPVRAVVELWRSGHTPEEIPSHLPHLNMAQVFDALSYYSDNQDEINGYIEQNRIPDLFGQEKAE